MSGVVGAQHFHAMGMATEHKIHRFRGSEFSPEGCGNAIKNRTQLTSDCVRISLIPFCFFGDVGGMVHGQNPTPDLGVAMGFDQPLFQPIQLFMVHHCDVLDTTLKVEALLLERLKFIEQFVALLFLQAPVGQSLVQRGLALLKIR